LPRAALGKGLKIFSIYFEKNLGGVKKEFFLLLQLFK